VAGHSTERLLHDTGYELSEITQSPNILHGSLSAKANDATK